MGFSHVCADGHLCVFHGMDLLEQRIPTSWHSHENSLAAFRRVIVNNHCHHLHSYRRRKHTSRVGCFGCRQPVAALLLARQRGENASEERNNKNYSSATSCNNDYKNKHKMKIYTKTGDQGQTSLSQGGRVRKDDARIEAYGTLDELNAHLGLMLSMDGNSPEHDTLLQLQRLIIEGSAVLARENDDRKVKVEEMLDGYVETLEQRIDLLTGQLPEQHTFLLPGGCCKAAETHVARVVCRRAERCLVTATSSFFGSAAFGRLLNRMSDYLYMVARKYNADEGIQENIMP